jgi:hypothetical protein
VSTVMVRVEKPGTLSPAIEWAITFPVDESLLEDPCSFGAYTLETVRKVRNPS